MSLFATKYQSLGKLTLAGVLIFLLASPMTTMAASEGGPPIDETITVKASVKPYAAVVALYPSPDLQPVDLGTFTGEPNKTSLSSGSGFLVETNVALDLNYSLSLLSNDNGSLVTEIAVQNQRNLHFLSSGGFSSPTPVYHTGSVKAINGQQKKTVENYGIIFKASTGPTISSQPAGDYDGAVTLTVSAHGI